MNTLKLLAAGLMTLSIWPGSSQAQDQQRVYYERAAKLYREAALKTKCPDRARYLNAMAAYQDCVAGQLGGNTAPCNQPAGETPPCSGDMVGAGGAGGASTGAATAASSASAAIPSFQGSTDLAQAAATAAYQDAIGSGRKESGAMLEGFLAAAQQTGDQQLANAYAGTGLVISGLMALGERSAAKKAAEAERAQQEAFEAEKRRQENALIESKNQFLEFIQKQGFATSFASGMRKAIIVWEPASLTADVQDVYISNLISISPDADGSYPMKEKLYGELLKNAPEQLKNNKLFHYYIVYPVADMEDTDTKISFLSEKAKDLYLNFQSVVVKTSKPENLSAGEATKTVDFWGNPIKTTNTNTPSTKQKTNDFWKH